MQLAFLACAGRLHCCWVLQRDLRGSLQCEVTPASGIFSLQDCFRSVTGLPISPYFSAFKFLWLLQNVPAVTEAVKAGAASVGGLLLSCCNIRQRSSLLH